MPLHTSSQELIIITSSIPCLSLGLDETAGYYPKWIDEIAEVDRAFGIDTRESAISLLVAKKFSTMGKLAADSLGSYRLLPLVVWW